MHVLFLSDNFAPETNAPASRLHEHARRWVRDGHRVTVVTGAPNFPQGRVHAGYRNRWLFRERIDGIDVVRVKTFIAANRGVALRTLDYLSFLVAGFLGGLLPARPDVVVATSPQLFAAVAGWAVAAVRRRPFVLELRDLWPASVGAVGAVRRGLCLWLLERLELFLYRRARAVVVLTEAFRSDLVRRGIDAAKIEVVTNGVDLERYAPRSRDPELARSLDLAGRFVVGYVGTQGMAHALERVLDAAELLRAEPRVRFLFVGDGAARPALEAEAARRALANVVFHPSLPKERVPLAWSLCDVALVHLRDAPLFATVIPSKVFEALGMGLPLLLAAPDGEAAAIVRDTGAGLAVAPEDPAALADALARLLADDELRARLGAAGPARIDARFRPERMVAAYEALYREVLAEGGRS
jgi:glycosyltransferase involved in cell wall biosynthesis